MKSKKNGLDYESLNTVIGISKNILKLLFAILILSVVIIALYLFKELKIFVTIGNVLKVASPLFIGLIIAWLLDPLVTKLTKKNVKRSLATVFVFIGFILVLYVIIRLMAPLLYKQINDFIGTLPSLLGSIKNVMENFLDNFSGSGIDLANVKNNMFKSIENLSGELTTSLPTTVINVASSLVSSIGTFLIGLVVGFYLLIDFDGVKHVLDFVPKKHHKMITTIAGKLNGAFRDFVQGTLTISLCIAIISWLGYGLVGLPSSLLFGIICGITNIIPYIGPWIGGAICAIVGFSISPLTGVLTVAVALVIQQIDSILLQPLIMGKTMKLHPVTIMIGLLVFGYFFGIIGMIIATPIMSAFKVILNYFDEQYDLMQKLKLKKEKKEVIGEKYESSID